MKSYNKRTWLNGIESSSTSSVVAFDGEVKYPDRVYRDTFIKISDCNRSIILHKKDTDTTGEFIDKLKLLKTEIELFIDHLSNN